jgi:hypothetical protein
MGCEEIKALCALKLPEKEEELSAEDAVEE